MTGYRVVGATFDPDPEPVTTSVVWDRSLRLWRVLVLDASGGQVGDADYEPRRADAHTLAPRMLARARADWAEDVARYHTGETR